MALAAVLLLIPIVALLWVPSYAKVDPELFGFPFFFWYQFLWVFICSALTWTAYRLTLSARSRTSHQVGEDR
jgi:membrane protein implicated in regulation of membrane protease activity